MKDSGEEDLYNLVRLQWMHCLISPFICAPAMWDKSLNNDEMRIHAVRRLVLVYLQFPPLPSLSMPNIVIKVAKAAQRVVNNDTNTPKEPYLAHFRGLIEDRQESLRTYYKSILTESEPDIPMVQALYEDAYQPAHTFQCSFEMLQKMCQFYGLVSALKVC